MINEKQYFLLNNLENLEGIMNFGELTSKIAKFLN